MSLTVPALGNATISTDDDENKFSFPYGMRKVEKYFKLCMLTAIKYIEVMW
jgi:hypothetical protein